MHAAKGWLVGDAQKRVPMKTTWCHEGQHCGVWTKHIVGSTHVPLHVLFSAYEAIVAQIFQHIGI
jgi:hypothetical protein